MCHVSVSLSRLSSQANAGRDVWSRILRNPAVRLFESLLCYLLRVSVAEPVGPRGFSFLCLSCLHVCVARWSLTCDRVMWSPCGRPCRGLPATLTALCFSPPRHPSVCLTEAVSSSERITGVKGAAPRAPIMTRNNK